MGLDGTKYMRIYQSSVVWPTLGLILFYVIQASCVASPQRNLIQQRKLAQEGYWAAFVLIGNWRPLEKSR